MKLGLGSVVVSAVVVVVVGVVLAALLESHAAHPLFDDDLLHKIANEASKKYLTAQEVDKQLDNNVKQNLTLDDMFDEVTAKLMKAYPGHIFDGQLPPPKQRNAIKSFRKDTTWVFNCAGGFKTGMRILHASLTGKCPQKAKLCYTKILNQ